MLINRFWQGTRLTAILFTAIGCMYGFSVNAAVAQSATYNGIPVGFTEEGHPYLGKADAPVTLEEWSDYLCPYCSRHFQQTFPALLDNYVRSGQMKIVFRDLPLDGLHPTAAVGHIAARCVGQQGAAAYWEMHDALFARQGEWNRLPDPAAFVESVAEELGVDMQAYSVCLAEGEMAERVANDIEHGTTILDFYGTPSFRFSSADSDANYSMSGAHPLARFATYADALIAGEAPPEDPEPKPPEMPLWAKAEGLAPDPDRPGFTIAGDAYKGNSAAALVIVEFNDFQCPACQKHALETQPLIDAEFVDTDKVLWVEKHLPLKMHPYAAIAAVAAECAGDQQKYWPMQKRLHAELEHWANDNAEKVLPTLAEQLGLNMQEFQHCFDSRKALERVLADIYDAQGLITRAPTFVIFQDGRGSATGPLPADQFLPLISGRLEPKDSTAQQSDAANSAEDATQ
jgi:protein-disulfide isomerase